MPKDKKKKGLAKEMSPQGSSFGGRLIGRIGKAFGGAKGKTTRNITDGRGPRPNDRFNKKNK